MTYIRMMLALALVAIGSMACHRDRLTAALLANYGASALVRAIRVDVKNQALPRFNRAAQALKLASEYSSSPRHSYLLAVIYQLQGEASTALLWIDKALESEWLDGNHLRFIKGLVLSRQGNIAAATTVWKQMSDPLPYLVSRCYGYRTMGDYRTAEEYCEAAVLVDPRNGWARYHLASTQRMTRGEAVAEEQIRLAIDAEPATVSYRLFLVDLLTSTGRSEEAAAQIELILKLDPGNTDALKVSMQMHTEW